MTSSSESKKDSNALNFENDELRQVATAVGHALAILVNELHQIGQMDGFRYVDLLQQVTLNNSVTANKICLAAMFEILNQIKQELPAKKH